jgi:hypothetical protein
LKIFLVIMHSGAFPPGNSGAPKRGAAMGTETPKWY